MRLTKAFSLIEMLVALLLLSMLIGIALFAFKAQLISIQKVKETGINKVIKFNQLKSSLESIKYFVVDDYDMLNRPMKNLHFFFHGTKTEMNFITENPLFSDHIALAKLSCTEKTLTYQEEKLYSKIDFLRPTLPKDAREILIYDDLEKCQFSYKKNQKTEATMTNTIPTSLLLKINKDEIYINTKNDNNTSLYKIYSAVYEEGF